MRRKRRLPLLLGLAGPLMLAACSAKVETEYVSRSTAANLAVQDAAGADLDGGTLDTPSATPGSTAPTTWFYLRNTGGRTLRGPSGGGIAISLGGANPSAFSVSPLSVPDIPGGSSAQIAVRFCPGASDAETLTADVTVDVEDAAQQATFTLSGAIDTPSIASTSPANGAYHGGTTVTVTGTDFAPGASVSVGGAQAASVSVNADGTRITCVTPAGALGPADVVVDNGNGDTDTAAGVFEYSAVALFQRLDGDGVLQIYAYEAAAGQASERQLTDFPANPVGLTFVAKAGNYALYERTEPGGMGPQFYSLDVATGTWTAVTNRTTGNPMTYLGVTSEAVPRLVFRETIGGWEYLFSARVDGSDCVHGAVPLSSLPMWLATAGKDFLITQEALPRVVFVCDVGLSPRFLHSVLVDGSEYGAERQLVGPSYNTTYLYAVADRTIGSDTAPRAIFREITGGVYDLHSVPVDDQYATSPHIIQLTVGSYNASFRALTSESTPRVIFYRSDSANVQLWSVQIDQTEASVLQLTNGTSNVDLSGSASAYGGYVGSGTPPMYVFRREDPSGTPGQNYIFSVPVDGDSSGGETGVVTRLSSTANNCVFKGILRVSGQTDRVFWERIDANLNRQVYMRDIDGSGTAPVQVTSGDSLTGSEDSTFRGVVLDRYVITERPEDTAPSTVRQAYSWDLTAQSETLLTEWYAAAAVGITVPNWQAGTFSPAGNPFVGVMVSGATTEFYAVRADGSEAPVQVTNSVNTAQAHAVFP